ncbi:hypothetical protein [Nonomuraea endophytica]|uniref:Rpn family recombination-promoting nuclease/putative transposase n=1 Tax=Nonomuraea endophytica TaxID=714136 RepID=A0A7W7ZW10_9ACTN|nr:hypothetical protein [Nonomuraea endophytica]MBB5074842.1 hypothetical protein [Nonomuraea endophytica]
MDLFRNHPLLAPTLVGEHGVDIPSHDQVCLESGDFPDIQPTEYRADAVMVLRRRKEAQLAVIVEVQLKHDKRKEWSWPVYMTTLRARLKCPVVLLVACPCPNATKRYSKPIPLGHPGMTLLPLMVGPGSVPVISDVKEALERPELATLSAIMHSKTSDATVTFETFRQMLVSIPVKQRSVYCDAALGGLPYEVAIAFWRELMSVATQQFKSPMMREFQAEFVAKGKALGEAESIVKLLRLRGIEVPEDTENLILSCTYTEQLDAWLADAVTISHIDELFD